MDVLSSSQFAHSQRDTVTVALGAGTDLSIPREPIFDTFDMSLVRTFGTFPT